MGSEAYAFVKDLGIGNFGIAKLLQHRQTGQLVAAKYIERGPDKIDKNVEREILNHHQLSAHPNIVHFHEVLLTPTHLIIIMEFAAGGELFDRIVAAGRFSEDESRYFFQQLISGVDYCHQSGICHRDLKLENTLLDGSAVPKLKICDFGYSKSSQDSQPKSTVGTPAYIAPEVLMRKCYSGQAADVWSCGVTLYVMLCGAYPFEDSRDPRNFRKTIQKIMAARFVMPPVSLECQDLLQKIFTPNPQARITMSEIRQHPWFVKNLPQELAQPAQAAYTQSTNKPIQNMDGIRALIQAARVVPKPPMLSRLLGFPLGLGTPVGHIPHPGMPTPCTMNQCHPHPQPPCVSMQQQPQYPSMQQQSCMGTQQPPSCMVMQQPPSCMGMQQLHDAALADNVLEADQNSLPTEIMPCSEYEEAMDARRSAHEAGKGAAQGQMPLHGNIIQVTANAWRPS